MNENYLGSNFDDFLAEEGILAEVESLAAKQVRAYQLALVSRIFRVRSQRNKRILRRKSSSKPKSIA